MLIFSQKPSFELRILYRPMAPMKFSPTIIYRRSPNVRGQGAVTRQFGNFASGHRFCASRISDRPASFSFFDHHQQQHGNDVHTRIHLRVPDTVLDKSRYTSSNGHRWCRPNDGERNSLELQQRFYQHILFIHQNN